MSQFEKIRKNLFWIIFVFISFSSTGFLINEYSKLESASFTNLSIKESIDREESKSDRTYETNDQILLQFVVGVFAKIIHN